MSTATRFATLAGVIQIGIAITASGGLGLTQEREFEVRGAPHSVIRFTPEGRSVGSYRSGAEVRGYLQAEGIFVSFNGLDMNETAAFAVNTAGDAVGTYRDVSGRVHGFVWRDGRRQDIDIPGAWDTAAFGIADSGEVVGAYRSPDCQLHGFRWTPQDFTTVDADRLGASSTIITGIDSDGTLIGQYSPADNPPGCAQFPISTALLPNGRAFVLRAGVQTLVDVPGAAESIALGFNATKEIVGQYKDAAGRIRGFAVANGTVQSFDLSATDNLRRLGSSVSWFSTARDQIR
jgi:hypothetical protein